MIIIVLRGFSIQPDILSLFGAACRSLFTWGSLNTPCLLSKSLADGAGIKNASSITPPPLLSLKLLHPVTTAQMLGFSALASGWVREEERFMPYRILASATAITPLSDVDSGDAPAAS